jgi:hypothetical protein
MQTLDTQRTSSHSADRDPQGGSFQAQRADVSGCRHQMPPALLAAAALVAACRAVVAVAGVMMTAALAARQVTQSYACTTWPQHAG